MSDPGAASLGELWLDAFERGLTEMFSQHFGDVDWGCLLDRAGLTVTAGHRLGGASVTVELPRRYLGQGGTRWRTLDTGALTHARHWLRHSGDHTRCPQSTGS